MPKPKAAQKMDLKMWAEKPKERKPFIMYWEADTFCQPAQA
ncbi:uncharacterized protein G2W53_020356 [Senna tora]|uniref:Uncharacterized protein n=1 Tax=Senna tora TaxID=362788 RepID=A0A834WNI8_9FABA|nr:uncharacterized protein G2W53_020356 [Senna tora]